MNHTHQFHRLSEQDFARAIRINGDTTSSTPTVTTEPNGATGFITRTTHMIYQGERLEVSRCKDGLRDILDFVAKTPVNHINVYPNQFSNGPFAKKPLIVDFDGELLLVVPSHDSQVIRFTTSDDDDHIHIHQHLLNPVEIHTKDGNDRIITEDGFSDIYAGAGDDDITVAGYSHVEGGEGNDEINAAGQGHCTLYGGPGDDTLKGSDNTAVILGGEGNDTLTGGGGHSIICAGPGDDFIEAGTGHNVIYTGEGSNEVEKLKPTDITYHNVKSELIVDCTKITPEQMDAFPPGQIASHAIQLEPRPLDLSAFVISGSPLFVGRAKDDLYLLNASPTGQRLLSVLEQAFRTSGKPITITELVPRVNGEFIPDDSSAAELAYIDHQKAGKPAYGGHIWYSARNGRLGAPSVITLFHELCHAYNHVTGTKLRGTSLDGVDEHYPRNQIDNTELQAVGLPTSEQAFDFDNDPSTPPTNTNPETFSENGLRKELGWPLRTQYAID